MPPPHAVAMEVLDDKIRAEILAGLGRTTVVALIGLAIAIVIGVGVGHPMAQVRGSSAHSSPTPLCCNAFRSSPWSR